MNDQGIFKVQKARPKGFKPTFGNVMWGAFGFFLVVGGTLATQSERVPTMTFSQCVAQVSTSPDTFEDTLEMGNGERYKAEFMLMNTSDDGRRLMNVRLFIPKADRIIDIDVVDRNTFAVSFAVGEEVSVQIVDRRRHWAECDSHMYINDLVAVPGAH